MADLYKGYDAFDKGFHGGADNFYGSICLWRSDVALDCQYGFGKNDPVSRLVHTAGTIYNQLSGSYGRFYAGYDSHDYFVSAVPETVY